MGQSVLILIQHELNPKQERWGGEPQQGAAAVTQSTWETWTTSSGHRASSLLQHHQEVCSSLRLLEGPMAEFRARGGVCLVHPE